MFTRDRAIAKAILLLVAGSASLCWAAEKYGLGRVATPQAIAGWDIDVRPDGAGLPQGSGTVALGKTVYDSQCGGSRVAHGDGGPSDREAHAGPAGGRGTVNT